FLIFNELEQRFSASTTVTCFLNIELSRIDSASGVGSAFGRSALGTDFAHTEITPVVNTDGSQHALIGLAERYVRVGTEGGATARAAYNLHTEGSLVGSTPDQIVLPASESN